jgi:hypothetical protein
METGTKANPAEQIDALHSQLVSEAAAAAEGKDPQPVAPVENPIGETGGAKGDSVIDAPAAEALIREYFDTRAEAKFEEFYSDLKPVVGEATALRIAKRACMEEPLREMAAKNGGRWAAQLNVAQYASPGTVFLTLLGYDLLKTWFAKRDRAAALKKVQPAPAPAPAIAPIAPTATNETKT